MSAAALKAVVLFSCGLAACVRGVNYLTRCARWISPHAVKCPLRQQSQQEKMYCQSSHFFLSLCTEFIQEPLSLVKHVYSMFLCFFLYDVYKPLDSEMYQLVSVISHTSRKTSDKNQTQSSDFYKLTLLNLFSKVY